MKEQMAASAHTVKNGYLLWENPIWHPNNQNWLRIGALSKTKKGQNRIFQTGLPQYGGNVKPDTFFVLLSEKWYFAGDALTVNEGG